jgi:hypothetical protein
MKKIPCCRERQILLQEKLPRFYQKVVRNWCHLNVRVFDWQHISYVWWACFSYLWVLTVHLFSPTCSFIRTRQTSYRGLFNKCGKKLDPPFNFTFRDIDDVLPLNNIEPSDYRTVIRKQMTSTINLYFRIFQCCFFLFHACYQTIVVFR